MQMLIRILLIALSLTSFAAAPIVTVYVVDHPKAENEFADLASAAQAVCAQGSGRVVVRRSAPLAMTDLAIECDLTIESEGGASAEVVSARKEEALVITAAKSLRWAGFQFSVPSGLVFKSVGDLELKNNSFPGPLQVDSVAGLRFDSNRIASAQLRLESSERPVVILMNQAIADGARLSLQVKSNLTNSDQGLVEVYKNTLAAFEVELCGSRALTLNLDANAFIDTALKLGAASTKMRVSGGRLGKLEFANAGCADQGARAEIEISDLAIDRLVVNWKDGRPRSEFALSMRSAAVSTELLWDSAGAGRFNLNTVDVAPSATIAHEGPLTANWKTVRWQKGVTFNALDFSSSATGPVSLSQLGGFSGGNFDVLANHRGQISVQVLGMELGSGVRVSIDRQLAGAHRGTGVQDGRIELRDMQFIKPGNYLNVSGVDGHVVVDNNKFNLEVSDFGFAGIRLGRQAAGSAVVTRNEFVVPGHCPQKCAGLRGSDLSDLLVQSNRFFVYGKYAHAIDLQDAWATIKENQINGAGHNSALIQAVASPGRICAVSASGNMIDANGLAAVQLAGPTFSNFASNTFSGNGVFNDEANGLTENPLLTNSGLHEKNVMTAVDFDGNGCRDIPKESNERLPSGECRVVGMPKPSFPKKP